MGCILACLRFEDNRKRNNAPLKSSPIPSKIKEPLLSEDQFVSVFISEGSPCEQLADLNFWDNNDQGIFERELRDEVSFLKTCGAILETPAELRKASEKLIAQPSNKDITFSSSSCLSATPIKKLVWEEQEDSKSVQNNAVGSNSGKHQAQRHDDRASHTSSCASGMQKLVLDEEQEDSNFEQHSSSGFIFGVHQTQKHNGCTLSSASLRKSVHLEKGSESAICYVSPFHGDTKGSVCFGNVKHGAELELTESSAELDVSPSQDDTQVFISKDVCLKSVESNPGIESGIASSALDDSPSEDGAQIQASGAKNLPYPTPLKLTDEMETPCTVYPSTQLTTRKTNARVRTQFVYPVENLTRLQMQQTLVTLTSDYQNDKRSSDGDELDKENYSSVKRLRSLTPLSDSRWKVTSSPENTRVEVLTLSQWLKHPPRDGGKKSSCLDRTPDVERPIFGVVALHWNEEDHHNPSMVSSNCWGGNGIPNTTTKYKEDQKVSWHATPFEGRLDKALLDDNSFPRRKDISSRNLVGFIDEGEERDSS